MCFVWRNSTSKQGDGMNIFYTINYDRKFIKQSVVNDAFKETKWY